MPKEAPLPTKPDSLPPPQFPLVNEELVRDLLDPDNETDMSTIRLALRNVAVAGFDRRILRMPFWHIIDHVCKAERYLGMFEVQCTMLRAYVNAEEDTTVLKEQMTRMWDLLSGERRALMRALDELMQCRTSEQLVN